MVSVSIRLSEHQGGVGKNTGLTLVRVSDGGGGKPALDESILSNVGLGCITQGLTVVEFDSVILL